MRARKLLRAPKLPTLDADDRKLMTAVAMVVAGVVLALGAAGVAVGLAIRLFRLTSGLGG